jgi:hypothetical protein
VRGDEEEGGGDEEKKKVKMGNSWRKRSTGGK